jgi:mannosyltransferase
MLKKIIHSNYGILYVILILNIFIKLIYIDAFPISGDEPFTIFHAQFDWNELKTIFINENNPPLYFILIKIWIQLVGTHSMLIRIPSIVFSVLTVVYIYKIGITYFNKNTAILSSLIYTFSSYMMIYSHEVRVYSLFALLTTGSMYYFLKLYEKKPKTKYILLLSIFNGLLIYAHFFGFIVIFLQVFFVLINYLHIKNVLLAYLKSSTLTLLLYTPYFPILYVRFTQSAKNGTWIQSPSGLSDVYYMLWTFFNQPFTTIVAITIFVFTVTLFIIRKSTLNKESFFVASWAFLPLFSLFLLSFYIPMYLDRYLIFCCIAFYILIPISIEYLFKNKSTAVRFAIGSFFVCIMLFTFNPKKESNFRTPDKVVRTIEDLKKEYRSDAIIISPSWAYRTFLYHYDKVLFSQAKTIDRDMKDRSIYPIQTILDIDTSKLNSKKVILFLDDWNGSNSNNQSIYSYLNIHFTKAKSVQVSKSTISVYLKK